MKEITGTITVLQDTQQLLSILIDTTENGKKFQLEIKTTRHEDLQELRRGDKIKIIITNEP